MSNLPDSGKRESFETGAVRDTQENKGRYDLLPPGPLRRMAVLYEKGAQKYQERNWEKGIPASRCFSSAVRHLYKWLRGSRDEDHLAAAAWNIFAIMHFEEEHPEMIDTPQPEEGNVKTGKANVKPTDDVFAARNQQPNHSQLRKG